AGDLRRCDHLSRPGRPVSEPRRGRECGAARPRRARDRSRRRRTAMSESVVAADAPRQTILFTGHRVDEPDRSAPRFPAGLVTKAARRIDAALDEICPGPKDLALTQGAPGRDLLFAYASLARRFAPPAGACFASIPTRSEPRRLREAAAARERAAPTRSIARLRASPRAPMIRALTPRPRRSKTTGETAWPRRRRDRRSRNRLAT